jgi:hypothetical protein
MSNPIQALLDAGAIKIAAFPPNSRYHDVPIATLERAGEAPVAYLTRRFVPRVEPLAALQKHTVVKGDRLDNLAARYLGDPELFWRLADSNGVLRPDELLTPIGRRLIVLLSGEATSA